MSAGRTMHARSASAATTAGETEKRTRTLPLARPRNFLKDWILQTLSYEKDEGELLERSSVNPRRNRRADISSLDCSPLHLATVFQIFLSLYHLARARNRNTAAARQAVQVSRIVSHAPLPFMPQRCNPCPAAGGPVTATAQSAESTRGDYLFM